MSRDYTREILIQKYGAPDPSSANPAPATNKTPVEIWKSAYGFPVISEYESVGAWLNAVAAATSGWPEDLRSSVVADEIKKHLLD